MASFARGAKPSPPHVLLAAVPHRAIAVAPPQFAAVPKVLDMWGNDQYGDCVTAEEAFAKAAYSAACGLPEVFVTTSEVIRFARVHNVLNGARLTEVMDAMIASDGLHANGVLYHDGSRAGVDYSNEAVLKSAIATGPVKIAIDANALPSGAGNQMGWNAMGGGRFPNTDHCVSLSGYGPAGYLYQQLGVALPSGLDGNQPAYLCYTWKTIGVVSHAWLMGTCVESWVRTPTTPGQSPAPIPATVIVPGLVGGTWDSSRRALASVGLVISPAAWADPNARVVTQSPSQGAAVQSGATVVVGLAPSPVPASVQIIVKLADVKPGTTGTAVVQ